MKQVQEASSKDGDEKDDLNLFEESASRSPTMKMERRTTQQAQEEE